MRPAVGAPTTSIDAVGNKPAFGAKGTSIIAVSAMCMGLGASLAFMAGFIATELRDDLDISRAQVGLLVSVYFGFTGLASVLGGRVTERIGARLAVALDMLAVAAAGFMSAAIGTYWSLLIAAMVAGSGYALVNAGTNVAIGRAVPSQRRTLAMSIKTGGVPLMAMVSAALGPWSASRWGWPRIWVALAIMALIASVAAFVILDDDRPERDNVVGARSLPNSFIWFPIGAFLLIAGSQPLYSWVVAYLEQSLDASPAVAGGVSALASAVGVLVMTVNALRTDRIGSEHRVSRIMKLLALNAVGTALVLLGAKVGIWLSAAGAVLGISAQLSSIGTMHASVVDRAPHAVARATGWTMTGYYLGALFSPAAFGALVDVTDTFTYSWLATIALLALAIPAWARAARIPIADTASL